jgi:hypothetical protein
MVTGPSKIIFFLLLFVTMCTPCVWGMDRDVTIVYSNNINGQIYPAG